MAGDDALDCERPSKAGNSLQVGAWFARNQERVHSFAQHQVAGPSNARFRDVDHSVARCVAMAEVVELHRAASQVEPQVVVKDHIGQTQARGGV